MLGALAVQRVGELGHPLGVGILRHLGFGIDAGRGHHPAGVVSFAESQVRFHEVDRRGFEDRRGGLVAQAVALDTIKAAVIAEQGFPELHLGFIRSGFSRFLLREAVLVREAERLAAASEEPEGPTDVELAEGETLEDLKARMGNLKPKKQAIPADLLNNANSYDDKVALIRMIVADNSGRVAGVMRGMIES